MPPFPNDWSQVAPWLGVFGVTLAGALGGAWMLFRKTVLGWLDSRFAKSLESYKHAQQREIERLRFQISALLDRTVKIHQREFDALPEVWALLVTAQREVDFYTSPFRQPPNLLFASDELVDAILEGTPFHEIQKAEIRRAAGVDRLRLYGKMMAPHERERCRTACSDCAYRLRQTGIFLQEDLAQRLSNALQMMWDAWDEQVLNRENEHTPPEHSARNIFRVECKAAMEQLEKDIRRRLWSSVTDAMKD